MIPGLENLRLQRQPQFAEIQLLAQPLQSAFQGLFRDVFLESKSFGDAVLGFFRNLALGIGQILLNSLSRQLFSLFLPSGGIASGIGGGLFGSFNEGGPVTRDSARFSFSEAIARLPFTPTIWAFRTISSEVGAQR